MTAAMQLLRFVLNEGGYSTQTNILSPLDHLDIPASVIIQWGTVPQWAWSIWLEYRILHADTIMCLVRYSSFRKRARLRASDHGVRSTPRSRPGGVIGSLRYDVYH